MKLMYLNARMIYLLREIYGFRPRPGYDTGVRSGCSDRDALEISVCVDSDAGESLSCCKDATGPDFLLAFPCSKAAKVIGKKKGTGEERDHAGRLGNFDKKESFSKGVDSST